MQGDGLVWLGLQNLLVDPGGLGQAARIEVLSGSGEGLLNVDFILSLPGLLVEPGVNAYWGVTLAEYEGAFQSVPIRQNCGKR